MKLADSEAAGSIEVAYGTICCSGKIFHENSSAALSLTDARCFFYDARYSDPILAVLYGRSVADC